MSAFFESHCHLNHARFDGDREEVMSRARAAGITAFLNIGYDLPSSRWAVALARPEEGVYAAVGIHPHDARNWSPAARQELEELAAAPGVVAWGEIGLDFYRNLSPRDEQERAFRDQAQLAAARNLPVVIHTRDSIEETLAVLEPLGRSGLRGVLHCWSGSAEQARRAAEFGFYLGFGGTLTYRGSEAIRESLRAIPRERILLETDAPYLPPIPHRGRRNEPAFLIHTAAEMARELDLSPDEVGLLTTHNAQTLLRIVDGSVGIGSSSG